MTIESLKSPHRKYQKPWPIGRPVVRGFDQHWLIAELDQFRVDNRYTIKAFAKLIGWSQSRMQNFLGGKTHRVNLIELEALLNLVGKSLATRPLDQIDRE